MKANRLLLVAGQIGRSGVDSCVRATAALPGISELGWATPAFMVKLGDALTHLGADETGWLPRRAAEALRTLDSEFARLGQSTPWELARSRLCAGTVHIPAYGHLTIPRECPTDHWGAAVRSVLVGAHTDAVAKIGSRLAGVHLAILAEPGDALIIVNRHPAELYRGLVASPSDRMRPADAVRTLVRQHEHLRHLAGLRLTVEVQYEDIALTETLPLDVLSRLDIGRGHLPPAQGQRDVPGWDDIDIAHRPILEAIAQSTGYQ